MKLHSLRYFVVLAEELHFGRAAARLAITQPPLSSAIKALEDELGVQLLLRNSKLVELTPAGAAFLHEARAILERVGRAAWVARAVAGGMRGRLDIGMAGSLVFRQIPEFVQRFRLQAPGIEVVLHELSTAEQIEQLLHGQLDAGFMNAPAVPPQLQAMPLPDDAFVLCLPARHRAANQQQVDLREIADEDFVMFAREVAPGNHDNVIAVFNQAGIHPRIVHAARQWLTIVAMVARGLGVALVPRSLACSRMGGVVFVSLAGGRVASPALLAWNPERSGTALADFLVSVRLPVDGA